MDDFNDLLKLSGLGCSVAAIVVDDRDPDKGGRFKCRVLGHQDDEGKIPDSKLAWIQTVMNGGAQSRTVGKFPPADYLPGSIVSLVSTADQTFKIIGGYTNNETDNTKRDTHPVVEGKELKLTIPGGNAYRKLLEGKGYPEIERTTKAALKIANQKINSTLLEGSPLESVFKHGKIPDVFGGRLEAKVKAGEFLSAGGQKFAGELQNMQKFMETNKIPEMIPKALSMLESLKQTAKMGKTILPTTSVGGSSNISSALSGIASSVAAENSRDDAADELLALLEFLIALYKQITGKDARDQNGNLTVKFLKWKEKYLAGEILTS